MEGKDKKQYMAPEIIYEADLELKAGTTIGDSPIDPGASIDLFPGADK